MNTSEMLQEIFFRLLNFGVFAWVLRYIYHKYIGPTAQAEIEADEKKVAIIAQQKDTYYQQEQAITREIEEQHLQVMRLNKKIEQWQAAAHEDARLHEKEHEDLEDALRKKAVMQSAHIACYMIEQRAVPLAIKELETSLISHFAGDERGSEYISQTADRIAKER